MRTNPARQQTGQDAGPGRIRPTVHQGKYLSVAGAAPVPAARSWSRPALEESSTFDQGIRSQLDSCAIRVDAKHACWAVERR